MKDTVKKDILNNSKQDSKSSLVIHNSEFHNKARLARFDRAVDYNLRGLRKKLENLHADSLQTRKHTFLSDFKKLFK